MTKEKIGKCHDCTAPQTEVNMLSRHILELQADKGRLIDSVRELFDTLSTERQEKKELVDEYESELADAKEIILELNEGLDKLYLSGLSDKQIAFIEQLQDKAEQFLNKVEK